MLAACIVAGATVACGSDADDTQPASPTEATDEATPRGPVGAARAVCTGASIDPDDQLALFMESATRGSLEDAIEGMEGLAGAHPGSATTRVRLGELLLRTRPPSTDRAKRWFGRALALHEERCTLGHRDHWLALEGAALSRMMEGDYAGALPFLSQSLERWPDARGTRYNLSCALCQTGDLDGCARALTRVLANDGAPLPEILRDQHHPRAHYVELAQRDPDLAPLRADVARFSAIVGAAPEAD